MTTAAPHAPLRGTPDTADEPLMLPAHVLRQIAESASGVREPRWFVVTYDSTSGKYLIDPRDHDPGSVAGAVVIPTRSELRAKRPRIDLAVLAAEGVDPVNLLKLQDREGKLVSADSVFWTESAVEKFMLPYYASVYGSDAGEKITELLKKFNGEAPLPVDGDSPVYALVHIPKSEYIDLGSSTGLVVRYAQPGQADQLAVVTLEGEILLPQAQGPGTGDRGR